MSAAIIAKNEERFIGDCLTSISSFADEIVVVDTGSTDATPDLVRGAGARLHHYPWDGSFANARNHCLDLTTGEWILYIDCDERIVSAPADQEAARRQMAAADGTGAFRVLFESLLGNTPYREYRVWRNRPDIRFHGVIHETMVPDLLRVSRVEGLAIDPIELHIQHLGYEGDLTHKHERNLPLLLTQVENDPRRVYLWWHLGVVHGGLGNRDEAFAAWRRGVDIVREDGWKSQTDLLAFGELAYRLAARGEPIDDLVSEGLAYDPDCHILTVAALVAAVRDARDTDVEELAGRLLEAGANGVRSETLSYPQRFFTTIPWKALAEARWARGDVEGAAEAYAQLLELEPHNREFRTKAAAAAAMAARRTVSG